MTEHLKPMAREEIEVLVERWRGSLRGAEEDVRRAQRDLEVAVGHRTIAQQMIAALEEVLR